MLKMNRKVEYALIALKYVAYEDPDKLVSVKEICEKYRTPFDVTSRVMQLLVKQRYYNRGQA